MHSAGLCSTAAGRLYLMCECTALKQMRQGFTSTLSIRDVEHGKERTLSQKGA